MTVHSGLHCELLLILQAIILSDGNPMKHHSPSSIHFTNHVALVGSTDGLVSCGLDLPHSIWTFEYDINWSYVNKDLYSGKYGRSASIDNIDVHETSVGCVHFGFKKIGYEHAGLYVVYDSRTEVSAAAFLQVVSVVEPSPLVMSNADSRSDNREPIERGFRFQFSGLMESDLCVNRSVNGASCLCSRSEQHAWTAVECSLIDDVTDQSFASSNCLVRFFVAGSRENVSMNSVCYGGPDVFPRVTGQQVETTRGHFDATVGLSVNSVIFVALVGLSGLVLVIVTIKEALWLKRRANIRVMDVSGLGGTEQNES